MSFSLARFFLQIGNSSKAANISSSNYGYLLSTPNTRKFTAIPTTRAHKSIEELLVVVGGGAAGVYGAIRAKTVAPNLNVVVKVSGEADAMSQMGIVLTIWGHRELKGSFFNTHGPVDTMSWFSDHGVALKGYSLATQLGHSIVDPVPSLFTFKIEDSLLAELSGVTFPKVEAKLKLENVQRNIPYLKQVGPMLVTHWGLSGPVILRLSAWGARDLFTSGYKGMLIVDFIPDLHIEDIKSILSQHKNKFAKQKAVNSFPSEFGLAKRFWKYILDREGQFKDEFVTAGGVPLSEIYLNTMESKICPRLFFAGEVLNVDGVTGGFNFQNAWSGGYIAGTSIVPGAITLSGPRPFKVYTRRRNEGRDKECTTLLQIDKESTTQLEMDVGEKYGGRNTWLKAVTVMGAKQNIRDEE
ncbi:hypothetical protein GH714_041566 [Hevea brasiliensis]|uniref:FAD-dependent oxidoreductase 2 FAD binding domain-containing protein n=1 Tax=Hevea brasiliensis TaxID=3981 RepID=A0A6A6MUH3_HEVBR|nr:hypothetical protein GH714_041566 [Hevea brasiliensis]